MASRLRHIDARLKALALWKRGIAWLLSFALLFGVGGFIFAWIGFAPVSASAGHWPVTDWFLHWAMRNAVELRSLGTEAPPSLDDPALVLKGAGHYATGCAPCHGAPGQERPMIPGQMTPHPPYLPPRIPRWEAQELFWIVRHGIKFTGMPAWPTQQRKDEVWAMVAFLQRLPDMDEATYRELAFGPRAESAQPPPFARLGGTPGESLEKIVANCARCHGSEGAGRGSGAFPILADQSEAYLYASLRAYARGERHSGVMEPIASALAPQAMLDLAGYYADQPEAEAEIASGKPSSHEFAASELSPPELSPSEPSLSELSPSELSGKANAIDRGRSIAEDGIPGEGIPACVDCHGPGDQLRNVYYPELSGQYGDYLYLQLSLFKSGKRGGTPYAHIMHSVAKRLTEEQMRDLAAFYASL
ncbi:c-type cytochrome [Proteobacteria bacterium 005FR1]|nr:c-type cytochrome [Proteobacteria bacterium 005FR1]